MLFKETLQPAWSWLDVEGQASCSRWKKQKTSEITLCLSYSQMSISMFCILLSILHCFQCVFTLRCVSPSLPFHPGFNLDHKPGHGLPGQRLSCPRIPPVTKVLEHMLKEQVYSSSFNFSSQHTKEEPIFQSVLSYVYSL